MTHNVSIQQIRQYFRQIASPTLPLHWLDGWLLWLLKQPQSFFITHHDYILKPDEYQKLNDGITKMQTGVPLAYLTGVQAFWQWDFLVNEHTLIPRADTEILVETVLNQIHSHFTKKQGKLLDLGTGTGCIGISIAKSLPNWQITLVDKSPPALAIAKQNIERLSATNATCLISNWYTQLNCDERFDVIVANPPYIRANDTHLDGLRAEPITALVAPDEGLADIKTIIGKAYQYLTPQGLVAIEHGYDQKNAVQAVFAQAGFNSIHTCQDFGGNDRVTFGFLMAIT